VPLILACDIFVDINAIFLGDVQRAYHELKASALRASVALKKLDVHQKLLQADCSIPITRETLASRTMLSPSFVPHISDPLEQRNLSTCSNIIQHSVGCCNSTLKGPCVMLAYACAMSGTAAWVCCTYTTW
jgi:hypothetical protein